MFSLRFDPSQIPYWAARYPIENDLNIEQNIAPEVRKRGFYLRDEFLELCRWKSPRSRSRVEQNRAEFIEEVTKISLATPNERLRVEVLTLLSGVNWPSASVLLHFGFIDLYPILDFRALWSLGVESPPTYNYDIWWAYVQHCRKIARESGVSMRILDRALWQYSKDNRLP